ncbi:hypothetical protein, partial [Sphingomonas sp.]|uniref:hypothetical protein n=1 Tax=Sphingomonas sp. TaxID=28214 RepID=UPI002611103F
RPTRRPRRATTPTQAVVAGPAALVALAADAAEAVVAPAQSRRPDPNTRGRATRPRVIGCFSW